MNITLNGEETKLAANATVTQLLEQLKLARERVAVEVNRDIVPKAAYDSHTLAEGDKVEIVHFVGGG